jgi:hypothetical protein
MLLLPSHAKVMIVAPVVSGRESIHIFVDAMLNVLGEYLSSPVPVLKHFS